MESKRIFVIALVLCVVESVIYWLGNPFFFDGLWWHNVPEMFAVYFMGLWIKEGMPRQKRIPALALSLMVILVVPILMRPALLGPPALFPLLVFGSPLIMGYLFGKEKLSP